MTQAQKSHIYNGAFDSLIGTGCLLVGHLSSESNVRIDGIVEGTIESRGDITIGEFGKVRADIHAMVCIIKGSVSGKITALKEIVIDTTAKAYGEVNAPALSIARGATFKGSSGEHPMNNDIAQ